MQYVEMLWNLMNTPMGITFSGFIILFIINKIFGAKPAWAKYEGWVISAIKFAEKAVDDKTENAGLEKADKALKYFIDAYTKAKGKQPSQKLINEVQAGIPIVHDKIEHMMDVKKKVKQDLARNV